MITLGNLTELATLLDATQRGASCKFQRDPAWDAVVTGVLRRLVTAQGQNLTSDDDVMTAHVQISGTVEWQIPVTDILTMMADYRFYVW